MSESLLSELGLAGTLLFGAASIILGLRALKRRAILWARWTETISTIGVSDEISILFGDKKLEEVHITELAVWNSGKLSIAGSDISKADPLRLRFPPTAQILSANVLSQTSAGVGAALTPDLAAPNEIALCFDILNPDEGFSLKVLHYGSNDDVKIVGTVRDLRDIIETAVTTAPTSDLSRRIEISAFLIGLLFFTIMAILISINVYGPKDPWLAVQDSLRFVGYLIAVLFGIALSFTTFVSDIPRRLGKMRSDKSDSGSSDIA